MTETVKIKSFPRSGSSFLTYLLHVMYGGPLLGNITMYKDKIKAKTNDVEFYRFHAEDESVDADKFLCIVRNPLESIIRHNDWEIKNRTSQGTKWKCKKTGRFIQDYISILKQYKKFNSDKKLIYFEEAMKDTAGYLEEVQDLIDASPLLTIEQCGEKMEELQKWGSKNHPYTDKKNASKNFDFHKHQKGMPDNIREYYYKSLKRGLGKDFDLIEFYFDENPNE